MTPIQQLMLGAGGASELPYIDNSFHSTVYRGNSSTNNITIPFKPDAVWIKNLEGISHWACFDSTRGPTKMLHMDSSSYEYTSSTTLTSFNANGFTLGADTSFVNNSNQRHLALCFKKQPGFLDIITWTGNGSSQSIPHNLGCNPAWIIIKKINGSQNHAFYFNGAGEQAGTMTTSQPTSGGLAFGMSSTSINIYASNFPVTLSDNGDNYIGYVFAGHNDAASQVFGDNEDKSIIKAGVYTGNNGDNEINLGWQPQTIFIKTTTRQTAHWRVFDRTLGMGAYRFNTDNNDGSGRLMDANSPALSSYNGSSSIHSSLSGIRINTTNRGFKLYSETQGDVNQSSDGYMYIAIRDTTGDVCKPHKVGTDCFNFDQGSASTYEPTFDANFRVEGVFYTDCFNSGGDRWATSRLFNVIGGQGYWKLQGGQGGYGNGNNIPMYSTKGFGVGLNSNYQAWMWKLGRGFDSGQYYGTGSAREVYHNLGAPPEMIILKCASNVNESQYMYHIGLNGGSNPEEYYIRLDHQNGETSYEADRIWNDSAPTATKFEVKNHSATNSNSKNHLWWAFRSVPKISKVGSFTGSNSDVTVTTGFAPRFMMVKRRTGAGDWIVVDTNRGWSTNTDQALELNDTGTHSGADIGEPTSTGFVMSGGQTETCASGSSYIYYAHA